MIRFRALLVGLVPALRVAANCAPGFMINPNVGGPPCVRSECDLEYACFVTDNKYYDKATGNHQACCRASDNLIIFDEHTREGVCCPSGSVWENGTCVPIKRCGPGEVFENGLCVPARRCGPGEILENGICIPARRCGPGEIWENGVCIPARRCGPGEIWENGVCIPAGRCGPGEIWENGVCVPARRCGPGEIWENGVCVPARRCGPGEIWENGVCVPARRCGPGEIWENGVCVPAGRCGPGEIWENGVCVPARRCGPGEIWENGICVPARRCGPGEIWENGICVPARRCGPGEIWENGVCVPARRCGPGEIWENGLCVPARLCPPGEVWANGVCTRGCGGCTPGACKRRCTEAPVCGNDKCIGLQYGKCYFITFPDGKQLVRERESPYAYKKDPGDAVLPANRQTGTIGDIPFKVCKTPSDCSTHHGECIRPQDNFYLQDTIGTPRDKAGTPGFDNSSAGPHQKFTPKTSDAAQFRGRTSCSNGECAIQLYGGPANPGSLVPACPMPDPGLTFYENTKVALRMHFIEVPCDGDYPKFWKQTGADKLCD